jgi:hypothetical protein
MPPSGFGRLFSQAEKIVVVMDNLNRQGAASFYEALAPAEARRLTKRFECHHPPNTVAG